MGILQGTVVVVKDRVDLPGVEDGTQLDRVDDGVHLVALGDGALG